MLMVLRAGFFDPPFLFLAKPPLQSLMLLLPCKAGCLKITLSCFEYAACPRPILAAKLFAHGLRLASKRRQRKKKMMCGWAAAVIRL